MTDHTLSSAAASRDPALAGSPADRASERLIVLWLGTVAAMVFAIAIIGAITRLTESGLSMVEWRLFMGTLPPLTETEWQRVFDAYRESPQYLQIMRGMALEEFKWIFFWEWLHRLWGRMIGLAYLVPLIWLWATGRVPLRLRGRLILLGVLGGAQGAMGWFMVQSGLVDQPTVSPYRLAAHLGLAFVIYGLLVQTLLDIVRPLAADGAGGSGVSGVRAQAAVVLGLTALTVVWGAFVAGHDAGLIYNSFPLMDGQLIPDEMWLATAPISAALSEPGAVQFVHRCLGLATFAGLVLVWLKTRRIHTSEEVRQAAAMAACVGIGQVGLGIVTVLTLPAAALFHSGSGGVAGVIGPVSAIALATAHQAGALVLVTSLVWLLHVLRADARRQHAA